VPVRLGSQQPSAFDRSEEEFMWGVQQWRVAWDVVCSDADAGSWSVLRRT